MGYFIGYCGFIFILTAILRVTLGNENILPLVLISGVLIILIVFGPVFFNEQYEEKHKGYDFLDILPVNASEIVLAKFGLVLVTAAAIVGYLLLLFSVSKVSPNDWVLVRSYILMSSVVCLLFAALSCIGIFSLGYTKFAMIVMSFFVLLGFVPILIMKFYRDNMDVLIENILTFLRSVNWLTVIPLALIGYFALMVIAIKIKE
jgi:ABC-type multidrug transport system permease subunit